MHATRCHRLLVVLDGELDACGHRRQHRGVGGSGDANEVPAGTGDLFADGAYDRRTLMDRAATLDFVVQVVRRHEDQVGFAVLPRRWVMERTFGWRDYERRPDASETMVYIAMGGLLLRRVAHPSVFKRAPGAAAESF